MGVEGATGMAAAMTLTESDTIPSPITLTALTWKANVFPPANCGETFEFTVKVS